MGQLDLHGVLVRYKVSFQRYRDQAIVNVKTFIILISIMAKLETVYIFF